MAIYEGLRTYDYVEGTAFEGLMPKVMEKLPTIGSADTVVEMMGFAANGVDALEVVDVEAIMEDSSDDASSDAEDISDDASDDTEDTPAE